MTTVFSYFKEIRKTDHFYRLLCERQSLHEDVYWTNEAKWYTKDLYRAIKGIIKSIMLKNVLLVKIMSITLLNFIQ